MKKSTIKTMIDAHNAGKHAAETLVDLHGGMGPHGRTPNRPEWFRLALSNPHKYGSPEWANWLAGLSRVASGPHGGTMPLVLDVARLYEVAEALKCVVWDVLEAHLGNCVCVQSGALAEGCPICRGLAVQEEQSLFAWSEG